MFDLVTPKQQSVLDHLASNPLDTVDDIAVAFTNSPNTIKQDLKGLYRAFDVSGRQARKMLLEKYETTLQD